MGEGHSSPKSPSLFLFTARGADLTTEADSGYTPMDLAVALGYRKGGLEIREWAEGPKGCSRGVPRPLAPR